MARRSKHDVQVDPFNAGEPTLPWDEPGIFDLASDDDLGEACAFGEEPYNSPTKVRDNYSAPDPDEPRTSHADESARDRKIRIAAERRSARRAIAAEPKGGDAKKGHPVIKAILIIVLLVNLLPLALGVIDVLLERIGDAFDGLGGTGDPAIIDPSPDDGQTFEEDGRVAAAAERECRELVAERLDLVQEEGSGERARIAAFADGYFESGLGYDAEQLGIDTTAFAAMVTGGFSYEIESCYVFADGTATVYFDSWGPSAGMIIDAANGKIFSYLLDEGVLEGDARPELSPAQRDRVRALFAEAIEEQGADNEGFSSVDLVIDGESWSIDDADLDDALDIVLGIW